MSGLFDILFGTGDDIEFETPPQEDADKVLMERSEAEDRRRRIVAQQGRLLGPIQLTSAGLKDNI